MYPYDSGAPNYPPNPNQAPYPGNQYPPQNQSPYPPGNQAPYPGYPSGGMYPQNIPGQPPYPGQNQPMPGFGGGFAGAQQQSYPGYPPQSYPNQPFPSQPGYPPQPGYPSQAQPGFPTPPSSTATHSAYADQSSNPSPYPQTGYPTAGSQPPSTYGGYGQAPAAGYGSQPPSGYGQPSTPGYGGQPPSGSYGQPGGYGGQPPTSGYGGQTPSSGYGGIAAVNASSCYSERGHGQEVKKERKGTPTVVPVPNFDPLNDAKTLRKAMKGFGTDEDAIINVLCFRTNEQRQIIQREFKTCYGKDLIEDIKSEVSGNFENLLVSMLIPLIEFYVKELHNAMVGIGTDEDVLIEVFCSLSNFEINTIKHAYYTRYMIPLEKALISETSGNFKRLLVSLCAAGRDESGHVDPASAQRDAQELLNAGQLRFGTDESTFNLILCKRNYQQLQLVCEEYQKLSGHSLEKAIRREFSGDIMDGLLAIVACVTNKHDFFASRLQKSMSGMGTKDNQLMRLLITRSEIDLHDIKVAFERNYGKSLKSWIKSDASGHYKHCLLALCGENKS